MLRLRVCPASYLLTSPSNSAIYTLRSLISAASPAISPHPKFAVEDYLLGTCGLTRALALKASAKLSHLKSSYKPDAVLAFLAGLGFSSTDVAPLVARDPGFLRANVAFLRECGLCDRDIAKLCFNIRRILTTRPERVQEMVARPEALGVPRGSGMFKEALHAVAFRSKEKITTKVHYLKKTFRWSDDEVSIALTKAPSLLRKSENILQRKSEFLISEAGMELAYIAHRPVIFTLSLEGCLRPRHHVLRFLKGNGFLDRDRCFATAVRMTNDAFVEKYICPHQEVAPHLAEDYAAACRGEVLANFRIA